MHQGYTRFFYTSIQRPIISTTWIILLAPTLCSNAAEISWQKSLFEADTYFHKSALPKSEACCRRAVKEVATVKHKPEDKVKCLEKLAAVLLLENKTKEAASLYRFSLSLLETKFGNESPKLLPTLFALGSIYESVGDHSSANKLYGRALAINENRSASYSPPLAINSHGFRGYMTEQCSSDPSQPSLSTLMQQPGLSASQKLEELGDQGYPDLITEEENSDKSLLSDFKQAMFGIAVATDNIGNTPSSQAESKKSSRKI